ncbi:hypothetical protein BC827DRAFT_166899 [Russula dissimulans]|nr:hypothetical protein BC827DRAFT_166899 [Russula dissimulans]
MFSALLVEAFCLAILACKAKTIFTGVSVLLAVSLCRFLLALRMLRRAMTPSIRFDATSPSNLIANISASSSIRRGRIAATRHRKGDRQLV